MNGWMYLVIAGIAEVFYAASMLRTEGFTRIYQYFLPDIYRCEHVLFVPGNTDYSCRNRLCGLGRDWCFRDSSVRNNLLK